MKNRSHIIQGLALAAALNLQLSTALAQGTTSTFSDANWVGMGSGVDAYVFALAVSGNTLYAGGYFGTAGGVPANGMARWDGSGWSALGSGPPVGVSALAVSGSTVYAGGVGGFGTNVAQWDGTGWSVLGWGMGGAVMALAVSGNTLYAGGGFMTADGAWTNSVYQWDGTNWSSVGSGINDTVKALAVLGTNLYAGGYFTTAGGVPVNYVARWDGTSWSPLGSGMNGYVRALAVLGTNLYAGGLFTMAGAVSATNVARWDGTSWSALGPGVAAGSLFPDVPVYALAASGTHLYVGGDFTEAGGVAATNIAQWDGTNWSALGSGMDTMVYALAASSNALYAGGQFELAGGQARSNIAEALLAWPDFQGGPVLNADGSVTLHAATLTQSTNRLYAATNLTPSVVWQPVWTNVSGGLWQFTDTNTAGFQSKFYRLSTP